jgi:hypothetical protein
MNANKMLIAVTVLQSVVLVALLWHNGPSAASAQVPDGGAQRERQLDELQKVNDHLDRLTALLESGKLQVRTHPADEK